jgi:hypothetical protein
MGKIDSSTLLAVLVSTGVLAAISQLILAFATYIRQKANTVVLQDNSQKLDKNNDMTAEIHQVTNGPLTNMESNVANLETQIDKHAAIAVATAEAAKVQAAVDASQSSQGNPNAKAPAPPTDPAV